MFNRSLHPIIATAIMLVVTAGPVLAHTSVVRTIPTYKSTLSEMPDSISIEFTDILMTLGEKKVNSIDISDPSGEKIPLIKTLVSGRTLKAMLPSREFEDGTYLVEYRVVSADGHSISGSYDLYLNSPSKRSATLEKHESFFHIHQTHLIQAGLVLIFIILWWGYRRFNREQGL